MIKNNRLFIHKTHYTFSTSFNVTFFCYSTNSVNLKQELGAINWYSLNKNGNVILSIPGKNLEKKACYLYIPIHIK
jgi:hypothetical protein